GHPGLRLLLRLATRRSDWADMARDRHGRQRHQARSRSIEDEDGKTAANVAAVEGGAATTCRCATTGLPDGVPRRRRRGHERLVEGVEGSVQARGTAGQKAARLSSDGSAQLDPQRYAGARGDAA